MSLFIETSLEQRIQQALDEYRPNLHMDGGDVEVLKVDENGVAHLKMLGACIDCPISLLTMKLASSDSSRNIFRRSPAFTPSPTSAFATCTIGKR